MGEVVEKTINKYLPRLRVKEQIVQLKNLPLFFRAIYEFKELDINKRAFLLIEVKDKTLGPKDFKKHSKKLSDSIHYPQIWYLKELHPHKVRRMIENELNFIVEEKQVHLPALNISIKGESEKIKVITNLSGLSINILIREILRGDISKQNKVQLADLFKTTKMTMGRALEPLIANNLCEEKKVGVSKLIHFKDRNELWSFLQKNIKSPVKEIIYLNQIPKSFPYSGVSALSKQSMLADDNIPSLMIYKRDFNKKYSNKFKIVLKEEANARVELWNRPATLLENSCINAIDIYLLLGESPDERIQIELELLLKKHNLEVGKS